MSIISSDPASTALEVKKPATLKKPHPFPGFGCIIPSVWEYSPTQQSSSIEKSSSPQLILLFSWTNGQPRHIEKYTRGYIKLFPQATIILVTTTLTDLVFRTSAQKQEDLQPAISHVVEKYSESSILAHCFSEGGSNKAVEFSDAFLSRTGTKLPVSALVLDSTPGVPRFRNLCNAFKNTLPNIAIIRFFGLIFAVIVIGFLALFGRENSVVSRTRKRLNDARSWNLKNMSRSYVYSKGDELISWEDVEEHAKESAGDGILVRKVRFDTSSHCSHMKEDEVKYWEAVKECWERRDVENQ